MNRYKTFFAKIGSIIFMLFFVIVTAQYTVAAEPFTGSLDVLKSAQPGGTVVKASLTEVIGTLLTRTIGVLGIVALLYIVYAGFTYMTSQSHEDVDKAKKTMIYLALGILILMSAYAITTFVFKTLLQS